MAEAFLKIEPVKGAAEYWAGYSVNGCLKPCVWMKDTEGHDSIIDTAKTIEQARTKANKWQQKENTAFLKSKKNKP
jgi:hypothetical protein